ncbi:glycoside hydrolase superfamily [Armillaria luteobubalina]|uniref:Glycoside hydrolase superfamily n=1 Tax=Armillaria luteobubalina TaxID=153913 RepID=A0AA39P133_9AGAR|nr:glycoside hydrolase superfamily [Armillaria luteobubalina]
MFGQILLLCALTNRWNGISVALAASTTIGSSGTSTAISTLGPTSIPTAAASFPPIGSIPRDYTPEGLEQLWEIVHRTGRAASIHYYSCSQRSSHPPPPLYPSFYAPSPKDVLPGLKFPKGFKFGLDTAAYEVEGATKNEGKGPTMWDWASRQPNGVSDNTTGDVVDLQYFLYKEDVQRSAALGVTAHSFSISWARIYPFGAADSPVNTAGLDHYSDVIDYHWAHNVEPVVTLFHRDTPLVLQAFYGAFTSPQIVDDFVNYAKTVFKAYNSRVKNWYTFNEPRVYCGQIASYPFNTTLAPGVNSSTAPFQCTYNLLKAHAGAVKAFREMNISGEIAFKNDDYVGTPWRSNSTEDALAVERHAAFQIGIFSNPVYTTGDWPDIVKETLPAEYLPRFTDQEKKDILGSADFFAIDSYRSQWVKAPDEGIDACVADTSDPLWPVCNEPVLFDSDYGWAVGPAADPLASWLQATPYVSEFGFAEPYENEKTDLSQIKEDVDRTNYFLTYLGEMLISIHEDGVPVQGAFAWAMLDNAEWASGTSVRFGIQHVNYTTLERTYKRSALSLSEFFASHLQD